MNIKTIKDKIKTIETKRSFTRISISAAIAVLGTGYMIFGKENSYAETPKQRSAGNSVRHDRGAPDHRLRGDRGRAP